MSLAPPIELASFKHPAVVRLGDAYWFHELSPDSFPGQAFALEIRALLFHARSPYQDILVFESASFGNVLVLNGIVQCTERDEFVYQELITNLAVMAHASPRRALVVGGGDCGVVRELVKHVDLGAVADVTLVEIDDLVIRLAVKYLPQMARCHAHPSVNIVIDDGFRFLRASTQKYDVIITDSSDPEGPAEDFFQVDYFRLLQRSLADDGVVIMQSSENIWLNIDYLRGLLAKCRQVFANVRYSQCYMPSYTSGQLGLLVATNDALKDLTRPLRTLDPATERRLFRYYNSRVHEASFVLPTWADTVLNT